MYSIQSRDGKRFVVMGVAFLAFAIFGGAITYACIEAHNKEDLWWPAWIAVGGLDFLALIYLYEWIRIFLVRQRFGRGTLDIHEPGPRRGQELKATYIVNKQSFSLADIEAFLIETRVEKTRTSGKGDNRKTATTTLMHHTGTAEIVADTNRSTWSQPVTIPLPSDISASKRDENEKIEWIVRCMISLPGVDCDHEFVLPVEDDTVGNFSLKEALQQVQHCDKQAAAMMQQHGISYLSDVGKQQWTFKRFTYPMLACMYLVFSSWFIAGACTVGFFVENVFFWFWVPLALCGTALLHAFLKATLLHWELTFEDGRFMVRKGYMWLGRARAIELEKCPTIRQESNTSIGNRRLVRMAIKRDSDPKPVDLTPAVWGEQISKLMSQQLETALQTHFK